MIGITGIVLEPGDEQWGYQRADCRGTKALVLFLDDLHLILKRYASSGRDTPAARQAVQAQVDELLAKYIEVAQAPHIFEGQSVTLHHAIDPQGVEHVIPVFSPHLKQLLAELLRRNPPPQP